MAQIRGPDNKFYEVQFSFDAALLTGSNILPGFTPGSKFGRNPDIDVSSAPEDVWSPGGDYTGHPVDFVPETVEIFSSDASDAAGSTGAHTIEFYGLRTPASTDYESEIITLNGTEQVPSVGTWWRINRAIIRSGGDDGMNNGDITIRSTTSTTNVFAIMPATFSQTKIAAYTVPAETSLILKQLRISIARTTGAAGSSVVTLRAREPGGVYHSIRVFDVTTSSPTELNSVFGESIPTGTDIKVRVESVSDNSTTIDASFEFLLVSD